MRRAHHKYLEVAKCTNFKLVPIAGSDGKHLHNASAAVDSIYAVEREVEELRLAARDVAQSAQSSRAAASATTAACRNSLSAVSGVRELGASVELATDAVEVAERAQAAAEAVATCSERLACALTAIETASKGTDMEQISTRTKLARVAVDDSAVVGCVPSVRGAVGADCSIKTATATGTKAANSDGLNSQNTSANELSKNAENSTGQLLPPQEVGTILYNELFLYCPCYCCMCLLLQGYAGAHVVRRLVETLDELPVLLETDPGELPSNPYRTGLLSGLR